MSSYFLRNSLFAFVSFIALTGTSFAQLPTLSLGEHGHETSGGGDSCRNEINKHRQMILEWIQSGDAKDLNFSIAAIPGQNFASYQTKMLKVLQKDAVIVNCYTPSQKKIKIAGAPTACINYDGTDGKSHIDCNYDAIVNKKSLEDPNYSLTHHEYASIAGVELRKKNSQPDFSLSDQLSRFEHWVKVKKLGSLADSDDVYSDLILINAVTENKSLDENGNLLSIQPGMTLKQAKLYSKSINLDISFEIKNAPSFYSAKYVARKIYSEMFGSAWIVEDRESNYDENGYYIGPSPFPCGPVAFGNKEEKLLNETTYLISAGGEFGMNTCYDNANPGSWYQNVRLEYDPETQKGTLKIQSYEE